ncbi:short-chain dehydrogenase [Streptomyces venezuelae]|uniref:Short-chain dehydrogenase n=1 Tax=Streptomyces venezuelae TaxID=54571 RepID=A0A5P2BVE3_STRVZ|nr:oxidoreductase [Streptomyces venezuelae]QES34167.1 short-chain dehydrogenase [Streptomyces venezuelae]
MSNQRGWTAEHIPDQSNRVTVVTGANSGLGLATTRALARKGAHVILAVRDEAKGRAAAERLTAEIPGAALEVRRVDLADLDSVRAFCDELRADHARLDVLINNAGLMAPPRRLLSPQGHEVQFATNHLGHFALTGLLLDLLEAADDPRVVTVSSPNHRQAELFFDDINGDRKYAPMGHYNQSKLANAVFGWQLHRRLTAAGSRVRSLLDHPGYTSTNLQTTSPAGMVKFLFGGMLLPLAQSPDQGALPTLFAATEQGVTGGQFIGPGGMAELRGAPRTVELAPRAADAESGCRLWDLSEEFTSVRYAFRATG